MKFKFAKPVLTEINGNKVDINYGWRFVIETLEQLLKFTEVYQSSLIEEGIKELFDIKKEKRHKSTQWGSLINSLANINSESYLNQSIKTENDVFKAKYNALLEFGKIYVAENGAFFPHSNSIKITKEIEKNTIMWPTYDVNDIRIIKWPGGRHFYAKIGKLDVVDHKDRQKWNSEEMARSMAEKYLDELIQEDYKS